MAYVMHGVNAIAVRPTMRGADSMQDTLFTTRSLESFVPASHPLRPILEILNTALKGKDRLFETM